jgi:large subunit ribosomal protein L47
MKAIRHALTERYYAWEDARKIAETDPEIDLAAEGNPYTPRDYMEEEVAGQGEEQKLSQLDRETAETVL